MLRKFHNHVKSELIRLACESSPESPTLLDFGCGRGGDLRKWMEHGVGHVVAVDPCEKSVSEAMDRARNLDAPASYNFHVSEDTLQFLKQIPPESVDIVSSMFSIHYLSREQVEDFMAQVHRVLSPGGILVLTFMDARAVLKQMGQDSTVSDIPGCSVELLNGRQIRVRLEDTLYFGSTGQSLESLVFPGYLSRTCEAAGMTWISALSRSFGEWRRDWSKGSLSDSEAKLSDLFATGVVIKHKPGAPVSVMNANTSWAHDHRPVHKLTHR
jgi:SAM-dependent methyltransferase